MSDYCPDNYDQYLEEERKIALEQSQWPRCGTCEEPVAPGQGMYDQGEVFHKGDCFTQYVLDNVSIDELAEHYAKKEWGAEET